MCLNQYEHQNNAQNNINLVIDKVDILVCPTAQTQCSLWSYQGIVVIGAFNVFLQGLFVF
jgi:hypothetical protein